MAEYQQKLDRVFHALSDPTRRAVIQQLGSGPASVSALADPHKMAFQSFSQHLKVLEDSGLVISEKEGRVRTCKIAGDALVNAQEWIAAQRRRWNEQFDLLDIYLSELQEKDVDDE
ncbi:MAG: metalloregulator ArsR/SmtB family transcription factor [Alphaproteobacteria bacterium]|nr:metalloregulator ArsR/SmtB family transcription factor [Alphaproteobacteria bacterium]